MLLSLRLTVPPLEAVFPREQHPEAVALAATALPSLAEHSDVLVVLLAASAAIIQGPLYRRACSIDRKMERLMDAVYGEEGLMVRLAIIEHDCKRNHGSKAIDSAEGR